MLCYYAAPFLSLGTHHIFLDHQCVFHLPTYIGMQMLGNSSLVFFFYLVPPFFFELRNCFPDIPRAIGGPPFEGAQGGRLEAACVNWLPT